MSESRKFSYRSLDWVCSLEFFPDRIENEWDLGGLGVDKRRSIIMRQELAPHLAEATTGAGAFSLKPFRYAGGYLVLAMFSYTLLPPLWRYSAYLFLAFFAVAAYRGAMVIRKGRWIQILRKDGKCAVNVQVTKWTDEERERFRHFYKEWISRPEWADGLTLDG